MSKVLPATCAAQVVTTLPIVPTWQPALPAPPRLPIPSAPLPLAIVLGAGIGPSTGIAVIDEEKAFYVPNISPDLAATLSSLTSALSQISTILTNIGAGMTGGTTAPPPTLVADLATLAGFTSTLTTLMGALR